MLRLTQLALPKRIFSKFSTPWTNSTNFCLLIKGGGVRCTCGKLCKNERGLKICLAKIKCTGTKRRRSPARNQPTAPRTSTPFCPPKSAQHHRKGRLDGLQRANRSSGGSLTRMSATSYRQHPRVKLTAGYTAWLQSSPAMQQQFGYLEKGKPQAS